jgi:hypothetical protein
MSFQEDRNSYWFLHGRHRKYCSKKCQKNAYIIRKYGSFSRFYKAKFGFWGTAAIPEKEAVLRSERLAVEHILPREGFTDIFWYSGLYPSAFTDTLAKKDGHVNSSNLTTCHSRSSNKPATVELSRCLGLTRMVLFIKARFLRVLPQRGQAWPEGARHA